jgi:hypothetical protein
MFSKPGLNTIISILFTTVFESIMKIKIKWATYAFSKFII